jgi:hypothetical protein
MEGMRDPIRFGRGERLPLRREGADKSAKYACHGPQLTIGRPNVIAAPASKMKITHQTRRLPHQLASWP